MLKNILAIVLLLFALNGAHAGNKDSKNPELSEEKATTPDREEGSATASKAVSDEVTKPALDETKMIEKDSSEYSVNKFNYLFYLIYKVKYIGFEEDQPVPIEIDLK